MPFIPNPWAGRPGRPGAGGPGATADGLIRDARVVMYSTTASASPSAWPWPWAGWPPWARRPPAWAGPRHPGVRGGGALPHPRPHRRPHPPGLHLRAGGLRRPLALASGNTTAVSEMAMMAGAWGMTGAAHFMARPKASPQRVFFTAPPLVPPFPANGRPAPGWTGRASRRFWTTPPAWGWARPTGRPSPTANSGPQANYAAALARASASRATPPGPGGPSSWPMPPPAPPAATSPSAPRTRPSAWPWAWRCRCARAFVRREMEAGGPGPGRPARERPGHAGHRPGRLRRPHVLGGHEPPAGQGGGPGGGTRPGRGLVQPQPGPLLRPGKDGRGGPGLGGRPGAGGGPQGVPRLAGVAGGPPGGTKDGKLTVPGPAFAYPPEARARPCSCPAAHR